MVPVRAFTSTVVEPLPPDIVGCPMLAVIPAVNPPAVTVTGPVKLFVGETPTVKLAVSGAVIVFAGPTLNEKPVVGVTVKNT